MVTPRLGDVGFIFMGAVICFLGFVFLIIALTFHLKFKAKKKRCTCITSGVVTRSIAEGMEMTMSDHVTTMTTYHPIYEYYADGMKIEGEGSMGQARVRVGKKVEIHYNPVDITEFISEDDFTPKFVLIFTLVGIVQLVFSTVLFVLVLH